jgi:signal peptidase I
MPGLLRVRRFLKVAAVVAGCALVAALGVSRVVRRYVVVGRSMLPAYEPGERLLVEALTYRLRRPRAGEVVVVRQPGSGGRLDLKRIAAGPGETTRVEGVERVLTDDEWFVQGDNALESTDSRQLGPVRQRDIVGRVWGRY